MLVAQFVTEAEDGTPEGLVRANIPFAIGEGLKAWHRHRGRCRSMEKDDFIQMALIGLHRATKSFDADRNIKFITYARWWILRYITWCLERDYAVHMPANRVKDAFTVARGMADHFDEERIEKTRIVQPAMSMNEPVSASFDNRTEAGEWIAFLSDGSDVSEVYDDTEEVVERAIEKLSPRQAFIIRRYFYDGVTLEDIGKDLELSKERVRQIKDIALKSLRKKLSPDVLYALSPSTSRLLDWEVL